MGPDSSSVIDVRLSRSGKGERIIDDEGVGFKTVKAD
jgi:hypothetical protein